MKLMKVECSRGRYLSKGYEYPVEVKPTTVDTMQDVRQNACQFNFLVIFF